MPNTSATAASSGADLNGGAIKNACDQIRARLNVVAAGKLGIHPDDVRFVDGMVTGIGFHDQQLDWAEARARRLLPCGSSCGPPASTAPPGCTGTPTGCRASRSSTSPTALRCSEVEVDGFTGAYRLRAGRHRARRRRQPVAADRPRPDRGRFRPGRRLADAGGAALGRERRPAPRPAEHPGGEHLQDPELLRDARGVQRAPVTSRRPNPAWSTAPRRSASRR